MTFLRVIGCSLSRNDWGLIPLIYTAQSFDGTGHKLSVEVIDKPNVVKTMMSNYSYLDFKGPGELSEFISFFADHLGTTDAAAIQEELMTNLDGNNNIMKMWLEVKVEELVRGAERTIETPKGYVAKFYNKE